MKTTPIKIIKAGREAEREWLEERGFDEIRGELRRTMKEQADCYDYVRRYYQVPAYIGVRVSVRGREGALVNHRPSDQYIYIKFDGDKRATGPFHPTDEIEYKP